MSLLINIVSGVVIVFSLAFSAWVIFKIGQKDLKAFPANLPIIQNYLSPKTDGYFDLLQVGVEEGKSGRLIIYGIPRDTLKNGEISEEDDEVKLIKIPVPKQNYKLISPGLMSKRRTHVILLPKRGDELTSSDDMNKALSGMINTANSDRLIIESSIEAYRNITNLVKQFALGEMSTVSLKRLEEEARLKEKIERKNLFGDIKDDRKI